MLRGTCILVTLVAVGLAQAPVPVGLGNAGSSMSKVVQLIQDMREKAVKAKTDFSASHETKQASLSHMRDVSTDALAEANKLKAEADAAIATCSANIVTFTNRVDSATIEATATEQSQKNERARRDQEDHQWEAEKNDLEQGQEAVRQAITTLDALQESRTSPRDESFLQAGKAPQGKDIEKMLAALEPVLASVKANYASKAELEKMTKASKTGLLQQKRDYENDQVKGMENGPGIAAVLTKLRDMSHEISQAIASGKQGEQEAADTYTMFKKESEFKIKTLKESIASDEKSLASEKSKLESAKTGSAEADQQVKQETITLAELNRQLTAAQDNAAAKLQAFEGEVRTLDQALAICKTAGNTGDFLFFLQMRDNVDANVAAKVSQSLKGSAEKLKSTVLSQLAGKVTSGMSFARLIKLINQMILTLKGSLKDMGSREEWCKDETEQTGETFDNWSLKEKTLQLQWNVAAAGISSKQQLLEDMAAANSAAQETRVQMAKDRANEKAAYAKNKADTANFIKGLEQVTAELHGFYSAEVQNTDGTAASNLMALLRQQLAALQQQATTIEMDEVEAQSDYQKNDTNMAAGIAERQAMIKQTDRELVKSHGEQQDTNADLGEAKTALVAASDSKEAVDNGCSKAQGMSSAEKQAQIESELAALKDALDILSS